MVVFIYPPRKLAARGALALAGCLFFGYGLHLWHVNAAPQQARIKARNEYIRDRLRKIRGDGK